MRPKTFLKCFALEMTVFKIKQLRIVLGLVLGQDFYIQNPSFSPLIISDQFGNYSTNQLLVRYSLGQTV